MYAYRWRFIPIWATYSAYLRDSQSWSIDAAKKRKRASLACSELDGSRPDPTTVCDGVREKAAHASFKRPNTVTISDIQAVGERIGHDFRPERVILFGSHARGTATSDSDVDLLVIGDFEGSSFRQSLKILNEARSSTADRTDCLPSGRRGAPLQRRRPVDP